MTVPPQSSTDQTLRAENAELRARLEDAEEMLRAIRPGEVEAPEVEGTAGPQLFTLHASTPSRTASAARCSRRSAMR